MIYKSCHVAWCPFCNQGWVDVIKDTLNNELHLLCCECDTLWDQPMDVKLGKPNVSGNKIEIAQASSAEIEEAGWDKFIISIGGF